MEIVSGNELKYGKFFLDFVNAPTLLQACDFLFKGFQEIFKFSSLFYEKSKTTLSVRKTLKQNHLNDEEKKLFNLIRREFYALKILNKELGRGKYKYLVLKHEREKKLILLAKNPNWKSFDLWYGESNDYYKHHFNELIYKSYDELYKLSKKIEKVATIGASILELQNSIPKTRALDIEKHFQRFYCLLMGYRKISLIRKKLNILFSEITDGKNLHESKIVNEFLKNIREQWEGEAFWFASAFQINEDGFIVETFDDVNERDFYNNGIVDYSHSVWGVYYEKWVIGCILDLLKLKSNIFRDFLHNCQNCENLYFPKTKRKSKYCSDKCRLAFHNRKRIKSGIAKDYKRKKRREGAKESYYG